MRNNPTANMDRHIGLSLLLTLALTLFGCSSDNDGGGDTPPDGGNIESVTIGAQIWMKKNLDVEVAGSRCYDDDPANCVTYGRLYTWDMAMTVCPNGWKLPSNADWETLINFAGGEDVAGKKLKAVSSWNNLEDGSSGNGTDEHGFTALAGGYYGENDFGNIGRRNNWWTSTEISSGAYSWRMFYSHEYAKVDGYYKTALFSVRCIKD